MRSCQRHSFNLNRIVGWWWLVLVPSFKFQGSYLSPKLTAEPSAQNVQAVRMAFQVLQHCLAWHCLIWDSKSRSKKLTTLSWVTGFTVQGPMLRIQNSKFEVIRGKNWKQKTRPLFTVDRKQATSPLITLTAMELWALGQFKFRSASHRIWQLRPRDAVGLVSHTAPGFVISKLRDVVEQARGLLAATQHDCDLSRNPVTCWRVQKIGHRAYRKNSAPIGPQEATT